MGFDNGGLCGVSPRSNGLTRQKRKAQTFESRYAVTVYERGCLLVGRCDPRWRRTVNEFRAIMGIPEGKNHAYPVATHNHKLW
jgi:hypothetical protein